MDLRTYVILLDQIKSNFVIYHHILFHLIPSHLILTYHIQVLFAAGLALAFGLDNWAGNTADYEITKLTIFGIFIAYIYSAPPLKLKV